MIVRKMLTIQILKYCYGLCYDLCYGERSAAGVHRDACAVARRHTGYEVQEAGFCSCRVVDNDDRRPVCRCHAGYYYRNGCQTFPAGCRHGYPASCLQGNGEIESPLNGSLDYNRKPYSGKTGIEILATELIVSEQLSLQNCTRSH